MAAILNLLATSYTLLHHDRMSIIEIFQFVSGGGLAVWLSLGTIAALFTYLAVYQNVTGQRVPDRKTRRRLRHRGKEVIYEYERD